MKQRRLYRLAQRLLSDGAREGKAPAFGVLRAHFFLRLFNNDSVTVEGDTAAAAAQAMMLSAIPSMLVGLISLLFLLGPMPISVGNLDDYFFVTYSFAGMGLLAVFEWEMLFADKTDFLILTPLPVLSKTMFRAKVTSLGRFMGMFLLSANLLSSTMVPGVKGHNYLLVLLAHAVSVTLAGSLGAVLVLAGGAAMLCVLGPTLFRRVLPAMQLLTIASLVWMAMQIRLYGLAMNLPFQAPPQFALLLPPFWFVGLYDWLILGTSAPTLVVRMALTGGWVLLAVVLVAVVTYPMAWKRKQKMAIEGTVGGGHRSSLLAQLLMGIGAHRPEERAVFAFIGQTVRASQKYQTFLTIYGGIGLAIGAALVVSVRLPEIASGPNHMMHAAGVTQLEVSGIGLHALLPLLLFWLIAGLRTTFMFPADLGASWVFASSGVELGRCAAAARHWAALQGMVLAGCVVAGLALCGWHWRGLLVQAVLGVTTACVLSDGLFAFRRGIPFTRARVPAKTNVAITVALYVEVLPNFIFWMADRSLWLESRLVWLWVPVAISATLHLVLHEMQRREGLVYEVLEEELEGTLTLGLS